MLKNNIKDLENKNLEIIAESNKINENYDKEIQKLKEELKKKEYFNNNEKYRIKTQETINRLKRLNNELKKELDNEKELINEYVKELNALNNEHK